MRPAGADLDPQRHAADVDGFNPRKLRRQVDRLTDVHDHIAFDGDRSVFDQRQELSDMRRVIETGRIVRMNTGGMKDKAAVLARHRRRLPAAPRQHLRRQAELLVGNLTVHFSGFSRPHPSCGRS